MKTQNILFLLSGLLGGMLLGYYFFKDPSGPIPQPDFTVGDCCSKFQKQLICLDNLGRDLKNFPDQDAIVAYSSFCNEVNPGTGNNKVLDCTGYTLDKQTVLDIGQLISQNGDWAGIRIYPGRRVMTGSIQNVNIVMGLNSTPGPKFFHEISNSARFFPLTTQAQLGPCPRWCELQGRIVIFSKS
ncbi:MAG: hypothetical protein IPH93_06515 [Saprospiraceae bacterium]|nr:hypothetical protein [Saprospiraceae bacterium]MBK7811256.1 hypothetical protein [Saprospiraceae bacterium]MBK9631043.1 hypothetical protein [Saprospiraceae bacterium]